jgi:hypothetical protein
MLYKEQSFLGSAKVIKTRISMDETRFYHKYRPLSNDVHSLRQKCLGQYISQ